MEVEDESRRKAPPGLEPLAKLGWQIRVNKYQPTARELEILQKCVDDARWYYLNGALLSGAVVWNMTSMGRKLGIMSRLFMTAMAAAVGRNFGGRFAGNSCMKRILSLEDSQIRGELVAILQEDFPNHPLLRTATVGQHHQDSLPEPSEYGQEGTVQPKERALMTDDPILRNRNQLDMLGRDTADQGRSRRIPRIWQRSDKVEDVTKDFGGAELLTDPFDLVMQTDLGVLEDSNGATDKQNRVERRRSRMSAKERREYDRRQYVQRQEQHNV